MKVCSNPDCPHNGQPQPLDQFRQQPNGNYRNKCKTCVTEQQRQYRKTEAGKARTDKWNHSVRGKEAGHRFDISEKRRANRLRFRTEHPDLYREQNHRHNTSGRVKQYNDKRRATERYQIMEAASVAVDMEILRGKMPAPKNLTCLDCGKQAREYHHHNGYDDAHKLDVIPLCRSCHARRHFA